jgi:imidazoleglycerol-phosphate dehydratase
MDEALASVNLDISGRPYLVFNCEFDRDSIGMMATEMVEEFLRAFAFNAGITLHVNLLYGSNDHHRAEAIFKALAHALKEAMHVNSDVLMSTKGMLE